RNSPATATRLASGTSSTLACRSTRRSRTATPITAFRSTAPRCRLRHGAHGTVKLLIERGAAVDVADANGRTPLALAVRAAVDSYWIGWRSPESVAALL